MQLERKRLLFRVVDLVRDHEHRLLRLAENLRDLFVARRDADLRVEHKEDDVCLRDRLARLVGDRAGDRRRVGDVDPAGVDEEEAPVAPLADELLAVARDAGRLVHDGGPRTRQAVDERRLPDVREADDRNGADGLGRGHTAKGTVRRRCRSQDAARPTAPAGKVPTSPSGVSEPSASIRKPPIVWCGWFTTDLRLYVGGRDRTKLVTAMKPQVEAVHGALADSDEWRDVPATPALLFMSDDNWSLLSLRPLRFNEVYVLWGRRSASSSAPKTPATGSTSPNLNAYWLPRFQQPEPRRLYPAQTTRPADRARSDLPCITATDGFLGGGGE